MGVGGRGGVGEGGAQRVEVLAEVLVRAGEYGAVGGATTTVEGAGPIAWSVRSSALSGGFWIHLHCTPRRVGCRFF